MNDREKKKERLRRKSRIAREKADAALAEEPPSFKEGDGYQTGGVASPDH